MKHEGSRDNTHWITLPLFYLKLYIIIIYHQTTASCHSKNIKYSNRKAKTIKIELKLPREPFTNLFEETDIQTNGFDKWNRRDARRSSFAIQPDLEEMKILKVKLKRSNQKLFANKIIVLYWEVLTENTCFETSRW